MLAVTEVGLDDLQETPAGMQSYAPWMAGMIRLDAASKGTESLLVQWFDADWFTRQGSHRDQAAVAAHAPVSSDEARGPAAVSSRQ